MASGARCLRSFIRSSSNVNRTSSCVLRCMAGKSSGKVSSSTSVALRTCLKDSGLLNGSRSYSLTSKVNFSKNFRPASAICILSNIPKISLEVTGESTQGVDGNLGDDEGESWSQNGDEAYLEGT